MPTPRQFGSRTKAEEVVAGMRLSGTAIVTGASSGIGIETARVLALTGMDVISACRSTSTGEKVAADLRASLPADAGKIEVRALDLTDFASIRSFAESVIRDAPPLRLLINNAGVMATPRGQTAQGHEMQVGTNHVGHFLLTKLLRPLIEKAESGRIVNVSSALHRRGKGPRLFETLEDDPSYTRRSYVPFDAYGDSKLANVLFTQQLAKVLPSHVLAFSLHPGVIATNLTRSMGISGAVFRTVGSLFTKSVAQGASTTIFAATAPELEGHSGAYLSDTAIAKSSSAGRDEQLAERLWSISEKLVAA